MPQWPVNGRGRWNSGGTLARFFLARSLRFVEMSGEVLNSIAFNQLFSIRNARLSLYQEIHCESCRANGCLPALTGRSADCVKPP